ERQGAAPDEIFDTLRARRILLPDELAGLDPLDKAEVALAQLRVVISHLHREAARQNPCGLGGTGKVAGNDTPRAQSRRQQPFRRLQGLGATDFVQRHVLVSLYNALVVGAGASMPQEEEGRDRELEIPSQPPSSGGD